MRCSLPLLVSTAFLMAPALADPPAPGVQESEGASDVAVGREAPDFVLRSLDGEQYRLSDRRGRGQVVVVFFRGAW